jgi:hypothetical protein
MKRLILGLTLGAMTFIGVPVALASPASAEPQAEAWYCVNSRGRTGIPKSQFYACPFQAVLIVNLNTGREKRILNGDCANQLWVNSGHGRRATPADAIRKCTERVFRR